MIIDSKTNSGPVETIINRRMKKSIMSKKGSCMSFLAGVCKDESALQLMKISLKKETDRKEKLEKLLQKYDKIHTIERQHVKTIKANIIELKDIVSVPKVHFLVDPNIYVNNNLSIETREFLCMLLNTYYKRYEENADHEQRASIINENIKILLKSISKNEELLFKVQKSNINTQVQMEGEFLSEKAKLKDLNLKGKDLDIEEKRVKAIWTQKKARYDEQKENIDALRDIMNDIESKIIGLTQKINEGEEIRQGNEEKLSGEMVYQIKFEEEVSQLKEAVGNEYNRQAQLKKKIIEKRFKIGKMKGLVSYEKNQHEVNLKLLELKQPRQSTKNSGMKEILEIERSFERAMTRTGSMFRTEA